jgi:predicted nucleic acid-binding protein
VSLRVVLDTNVVVSAALAPGPPAVCAELVLVGAVEFVASEDLLAEYAAVLDRHCRVKRSLGVHSLDRVGLELFTSREATGVAR